MISLVSYSNLNKYQYEPAVAYKQYFSNMTSTVITENFTFQIVPKIQVTYQKEKQQDFRLSSAKETLKKVEKTTT